MNKVSDLLKMGGGGFFLFVSIIILMACGEVKSGDVNIEIQENEQDDTIFSGVLIPSGKFNSSVSNTVNPVSIDTFIIAKTETTVEQYMACVEAGACSKTNYKDYYEHSRTFCNYNRGAAWLDHPMNCVKLAGAQEYCAWVGGRLPTEDEWQYAATHDGYQALETIYPWGNESPTHCVHTAYGSKDDKLCNGTQVIDWNDMVGTAPVGTYSAGNSPLGLMDMSGSVWEWTESIYNSESGKYVVKGGSWNYSELGIPVSFRALWDPNNGSESNGFRCIKDVENSNSENEDIRPEIEWPQTQWTMIPDGSFDFFVSDSVTHVTMYPFLFSTKETTVADFKMCVNAGVCSSQNYNAYNPNNSDEKYCNFNRGDAWLDHPMNCVNWYGANEYCTWIEARLPTEVEWQYAATHDGFHALETMYPWGNEEPEHCVHASYSFEDDKLCNGTQVIDWNDMVGTAPVGTYSAGNSPLGLMDMSGNVWEWTTTLWSDDYVVKGGSWFYDARSLPIYSRIDGPPGDKVSFVGFRCLSDSLRDETEH